MHECQHKNFNARITHRFQKELKIFHDFHTLDQNIKGDIFFVANELFDSMPCDIVKDDAMLYLSNGTFLWKPLDSIVQELLYKYEICAAEIPHWEDSIKNLCSINHKWILLTFDYGDFVSRDINIRMYAKHRVYNLYEELEKGSLMNFLYKSDITYDVDFSLLKRMFKTFDANIDCNLTQARFLVEKCDILSIFDIFAQNFNQVQIMKQKSSLQGIISPNAMGERFKALCASKL